MEINTIYQGDCLSLMQGLKEDFVDVVITSPPYNVGGNNMCDGKYQGYEDKLSSDDYFTFLDNTIHQLVRITKYYVFFNIQVLSSNKSAVFRLIGKYNDKIKEILVWNKDMVAPAIEPGVLNSKFELIIVFSKYNPQKRKFDRSFFKQGRLNNVIVGKNNSNNKWSDKHAAAFPEYFVRFFIDNFSQEGDVIFDPFAGTCTTLYCAKQSKRNYLGFEINQEYVDIGKKRLSQNSLFDVIQPLDVKQEGGNGLPPTSKDVGIRPTIL